MQTRSGVAHVDLCDRPQQRNENQNRNGSRPNPSAGRHRRDSDYADVVEMFRRLADLPIETADYRRERERIIQRCLPLAEHIARRYDGKGEPRDDLLQTARMGLVSAVDRFDLETGADFLSFAVPTIMGEVKRYFRDSGWSVRVPRRYKELHVQVGAAVAELEQRLGRAPTASELATELEIDRGEVVESLLASNCYRTSSIDAPVVGGDQDAATVADRLGESDAGMEHVECREALRPLLAALPERERTILIMRFFESLTQSQIAERLGISQMHVSRLLAKSLGRLRERLN